MASKLHIHQIIPFSNVDGPGNRCAIFLQGCNVACVYCHNPETIPADPSFTTKEQKTFVDGNQNNELNKDIIIEEVHSTKQPQIQYEEQAAWWNVDDLVEEIRNYQPFIRGITLSGGEPTLQWEAIVDLFKKIKPLGLNCLVDTNGFFDIEIIRPLIEIADGFLFDVKTVENSERLCGIPNQSALNQLNYLLQLDKIEEVRTVIISGYMDDVQTVETVAKMLLPYPHVPYRLIRVHVKGMKKYRQARLAPHIPKPARMEMLYDSVRRIGHDNVSYVL